MSTRISKTTRKKAPVDETCFVIMPFGQPFDRYFANIVAPAVADANLAPVRGDSLFTGTHIIGDIWQMTRNAKVLVADLTGKNANVFYELGLAHAIGKPVVLIASSIGDVPFDLRSLRVIIYNKENESWGKDLRVDITRAVRDTLKNIPAAVPLPFVERKDVDRPKEDPNAYEIRKIWDELRAMRAQREPDRGSASTSFVTADLARYIDLLRTQVPREEFSRIGEVALARAVAQVLASRYTDAVKTIRNEGSCQLREATALVDKIRALVERGT